MKLLAKLFSKFIAHMDAQERADERLALCREMDELDRDRDYIAHRVPQIIARLVVLRREEQEALYGKPSPVRKIEIIEDDIGSPDGLVGEWKAPV